MTSTPRSNRFLRGAMWFLAFGVAGYAVAFLASDAVGDPSFHAHFRAIVLAPELHILAGAVALAAAPFQLSASLRRRIPRLHRVLGRVYVVAVLSSSCAGMALALRSTHGIVAQAGFATLAAVWAVSAVNAFVAIRAGRVEVHRAWMIRNVSLTFAAISLRIYLPLAMIIGLPADGAYSAVAWLCWVPNLLVAGLFVRARERAGDVAAHAQPARMAGSLQ